MASTTATQPLPAVARAATTRSSLLLAPLTLIGAVLLTVHTLQMLLALSAAGPDISHLLALNSPVASDVGSALGPAGGSVDNMLYLVTMIGGAAAGVLLLLATGFWATSASARHPEASRNVTSVGFWIALTLSVLAMLPVNGSWQDTGWDASGPAWSGVAGLLALVSLAGLLLLAFRSPSRWGLGRTIRR